MRKAIKPPSKTLEKFGEGGWLFCWIFKKQWLKMQICVFLQAETGKKKWKIIPHIGLTLWIMTWQLLRLCIPLDDGFMWVLCAIR